MKDISQFKLSKTSNTNCKKGPDFKDALKGAFLIPSDIQKAK
jgi:hypothetical protein